MEESSNPKGMARRDFLLMGAGVAAGLFLRGSPFRRMTSADAGSLSTIHVDPIPPEDLEAYYGGLSLYWGDIHGHTGFSDGYGLPGKYLERARHEQRLDFAAISDYAEIMLNFEEAFPRTFAKTPSFWERSIEVLEKAYVPG